MVPEEIIVDANTLFSFFKSDSTRRQVFRELLKRGCEFFSTDKLFDELKSNKSNIIKFAHIDESDFSYLYRLLHNEIKTFSEESYNKFLSKAETISPHAKDVSYFALALSLTIPIWSDEKSFKKQSIVKVLSTAGLVKLLPSLDSG